MSPDQLATPGPELEIRELLDIRTTGLSPAQRQELLRLAHTAIEVYLESGEMSALETSDPLLRRCAGAFITLRRRAPAGGPEEDAPELLRGCIGRSEADHSLYRVVQEMAVAAASRDYRFPPLLAAELNDISIEISVLSPLRPIQSLEEVRLGTDGLLVAAGERRGLLLPQVPGMFGWSHEEFVLNLCQKAGLPAGYWPNAKAALFAFTALEFSDEHP